jgi:hypothetical protein
MYNQLKQMLYQAGQGVMINSIIKRQYGEYFANNHTIEMKKRNENVKTIYGYTG